MAATASAERHNSRETRKIRHRMYMFYSLINSKAIRFLAENTLCIAVFLAKYEAITAYQKLL
jgi:hypothetical protein